MRSFRLVDVVPTGGDTLTRAVHFRRAAGAQIALDALTVTSMVLVLVPCAAGTLSPALFVVQSSTLPEASTTAPI